VSPQAFATSPGATGTQRKFINPTGGFVGANVFGPDGKPTAVPVEPGGEVWLTEAEERMTAEAPRNGADNPFVKQWDEAVGWDPATGEPSETITCTGTLVLSDEPPRPVASDRYTPERDGPMGLGNGDGSSEELLTRAAALEAREAELAAREAALAEKEAEPETVKGADVDTEVQPAVEGQPSENEVIGTPEAPDANDEALAMREPTAEQPTRPSGGIAV
jgi:hypothetical protein